MRDLWLGACVLAFAVGCRAAAPPAPTPLTQPSPLAASDNAVEPAPSVPSATQPVCPAPGGCYGDPIRVGTFDEARIPEASGLAASRINPGAWWVIDDGPRTTRVFALDASGAIIAEVELAGFRGTDTEDLAVGACPAGSCLFIGDIGDNGAERRSLRVARLAEPDLSQGPPTQPVAVEVADYTYPGGAVDAEALIVDAAGRPMIVTKAFDNTRLFVAESFADGALRDAGAVPLPDPAAPFLTNILGGVSVTAGDAIPGRVLLRTYDHIIEYVAPDPSAPLADFAQWPAREVPSELEPQGEAVAWSVDGRSYATVSERVGTVWLVSRTD